MESNKKNKIILNNKYKNMDSQIQIITYPPTSGKYGEKIKISYFNSHDSVDSYKYNIINLNNSKIWNYDELNSFLDDGNLQTLKKGIDNNNQKSYFIILLPQNLRIHKYFGNKKQGESWTKNETPLIQQFIEHYFNLYYIKLVYGNNTTRIQNYNITAGFYMRTDYENYEILTKNNNEKITSIKQENIILTTLQLTNRMEILTFINQTLLEKETEIPEWFDEIEMFDDKTQKERINKNNQKIEELYEDNEKANDILDKNNEYKSILYKQSTPLVKSVFKILEEILICDLSKFKDNFDEDFLIEKENVTFIGEIKGVKSNVKREHLSQLDEYVSKREDLIEEQQKSENIQPLLIINRFRKYPPSQRKPVEKTTIERAENKFKTLIITTEELLTLYEYYKNGNITPEEIIERFKNEVGLFKL